MSPPLAARVVAWQRTHGRHDLPWQQSREPYRVWLSEVMLQQTQVSTVLQYYPRFLQRFPDVHALAAAPLDEVLALWSGLGYYSRARNLHRCAQVVVDQHGGAFPSTREALEALPGIGRSTAAAIAAFCFQRREAILDGNVKRVLGRALAWPGDLAEAREVAALWREAEALLPPESDMPAYTQGLMDLGATLCTLRKPACLHCPLHADCGARRQGEPTVYPKKTRTLKRNRRENAVLLVSQGSRLWLVQRPATGIWAGLWALPEYPGVLALEEATEGWTGQGDWCADLSFALTHLDWTLHPLHWRLPHGADLPAGAWTEAGRWFEVAQALALGLPAPVRKLLEGLAPQLR